MHISIKTHATFRNHIPLARNISFPVCQKSSLDFRSVDSGNAKLCFSAKVWAKTSAYYKTGAPYQSKIEADPEECEDFTI
jgi:hypothetical protein